MDSTLGALLRARAGLLEEFPVLRYEPLSVLAGTPELMALRALNDLNSAVDWYIAARACRRVYGKEA